MAKYNLFKYSTELYGAGVSVLINGVYQTAKIRRYDTSITDRLDSRNVYGFTFLSVDGLYRPAVGQLVVVEKGGTKIFAGTIDEIDEYSVTNGVSNALEYVCQCVDYNQILDRFPVGQVYTGYTAGNIVKDIIDSFININSPGEGITYVNVQQGPTISKAVYSYMKASQVLDELSALTGYVWYVDYNKDMHFHSRNQLVAPISLTDTSANYRDMTVKTTRQDYYNSLMLVEGKDITSNQVETFKGDGQNTTFTLKFPCAKIPSVITLNAGAKTLGIRQLETGKDYYWQKNDNTITQDIAGVKLISTDILSVTYQGYFPSSIEVNLDTEIASRKSVEGGSGIYREVVRDSSIDTQAAGLQSAQSLLTRYGIIPQIVEFDTFSDGLRAGQLIPIQNTKHSLNAYYLIESVSIQDIGANSILQYHVKALSGDNVHGWQKFFKKLIQAGQTFVIRDNEVLLQLRTFSDSVKLTDVLTFVSAAPESRVDFALVGFSECGV